MASDVQSAWIGAGAAIVVALVSLGNSVWTSVKSRRDAHEQADRQAATERSLAILNHRLGEEQDAAKAKRDYEYEARKRLYSELYPLGYQLGQAARRARHRIMNLALASRIGALATGPDNWMTGRDPYYFSSVIHNLIAPLAIQELITRKLTLLDLRLDRDLQIQHLVADRTYEALRSDFNLVDPRYPPIDFGAAGIKYAPPENPPAALPSEAEQRWQWRQGLYSGQIGEAVGALLISEGTSVHVMTYAEFVRTLAGADLRAAPDPGGRAGELKQALRPLIEVFRAFHPACRPITWRILLAQAACYRVLTIAASDPGTLEAVLQAAQFADERNRTPFAWIGEDQRCIPPALRDRIDFVAEQSSAFDAANRFLEYTVRDRAE